VKLDGCIKSWMIQYIGVGKPRGWRLLGGNPRVAAPDALAPKTAPMGRPNTQAEGGLMAPMTNTIIIL
jgi:hypothetical protein